jgi:hypothetical protein
MKNSVLVIVSIALAPGCALAQNGVVLINQATVAASGANRSTGGFPYTITQPGSYHRKPDGTRGCKRDRDLRQFCLARSERVQH